MARLFAWAGLLVVAAGCSVPSTEEDSPQLPDADGPVVLATRPTDWPMVRGGYELNGQAPAGAFPVRAEAPAVRWSVDLGGAVEGSVAVVDGVVFAGGVDGTVRALDLGSGEERWRFEVAETEFQATPLVLAGRVFVGAGNGVFYALDSGTGAKLWEFATEDKVLGGANWLTADGAAPAADGANVLVLFGSYDSRIYALRWADGSVAWQYETGNYVNGTPAVEAEHGLIAAGGCDSYIHVLGRDGQLRHKIDASAYIASSVALYQGEGFVGHYGNEVLAFAPTEGVSLWTYKDRSFPFFSTAAVGPRGVVIGGRDKVLHAIDLDGQRRWKFRARGRIDSSPILVYAPQAAALARGEFFPDTARAQAIFGSDDGFIYAVDLENGEQAWSYELGDRVGGSPAVASGRLLIGCNDGKLYCLAYDDAPEIALPAVERPEADSAKSASVDKTETSESEASESGSPSKAVGPSVPEEGS